MAKEAKNIYIDSELWEQARKKAGEPHTDRSLSYVVSHLLKLWLLDKIEVNPRQLLAEQTND